MPKGIQIKLSLLLDFQNQVQLGWLACSLLSQVIGVGTLRMSAKEIIILDRIHSGNLIDGWGLSECIPLPLRRIFPY